MNTLPTPRITEFYEQATGGVRTALQSQPLACDLGQKAIHLRSFASSTRDCCKLCPIAGPNSLDPGSQIEWRLYPAWHNHDNDNQSSYCSL